MEIAASHDSQRNGSPTTWYKSEQALSADPGQSLMKLTKKMGENQHHIFLTLCVSTGADLSDVCPSLNSLKSCQTVRVLA